MNEARDGRDGTKSSGGRCSERRGLEIEEKKEKRIKEKEKKEKKERIRRREK